ncbi:quinol dehydrogenase ferredoxin subunit NapH [Zoogloea sp.]|uniref:quinol dehydrogenase ferredoxin subunit NapH n=1 Tax=Zoogloea sp. TaxID=49181 RepID=UPI00261E891E|nr:quinol dehydrogenase ferredoxin subunit NapH [Zoogloea sp.]MDD3353577.1 quinol dehydrogenase ferredoxin subunit NapH [Zoogloea sp.]
MAATTLSSRKTIRPVTPCAPERSLWQRQRFLILRRVSQILILLAFLSGPWFGVWIAKGNLSSSMTLGVLPLTDPLLLLQTLVTGHVPYATALIGAAIVLLFYLLVGGRVFCSWVCPVNGVTDAAAWTRRRLGIKTGRVPDANTRYWLLGMLLVASALTGTLVWEWVNPVSLLHRSLIFGMSGGLFVIGGIFIYDVFMASRGWCGHLCPMGAFYSLLGKKALVRVSAPNRKACDDCMDCFAVCPEPQVIRPALKAVGQSHPLILASDCTTCGRCIDVCDKQVFKMTHRFDQRSE